MHLDGLLSVGGDGDGTSPTGPRQRDSGAAPALPCLFSNISNENREKATEPVKAKLAGYQKKRAESIQQNGKALVESVGLERSGFLTLTFDPKRHPGLTVKRALEMFDSLNTGFLSKHFGVWMRVVEFQKNGMPHFHLLIDCKADIREGFNWGYYHHCQVRRRMNDEKPKGNLNRSPALKELHKLLNSTCPKYGFGRPELTPIRDPQAVGWYVGGYMSKSLACRPPEAKGARFVGYARDFKRRVKGQFSWNTPAAWVYRQKLGTFAAKSGIFGDADTVFKGLYALAGPHWAYHLRDAILNTKLSFWPTSSHLVADTTASAGAFSAVPQDACNIRYWASDQGKDWHAIARGAVLVPGRSSSAGRSYKIRRDTIPLAVAQDRILQRFFGAKPGQVDLPLDARPRANRKKKRLTEDGHSVFVASSNEGICSQIP